MADYLLDVLDIASPYLPRALSAPLYTIANQLPSSPSDLLHNPSSLLPLAVTLFSAYFAFNQFLGTLRWGFRTALTFLKLGVIGTALMGVWMGYENVGTEKGVTGGLREAYNKAENIGRTFYDVGKKGSSWYFGNSFGAQRDTRAGRRTRRSTAKSTNNKKRMWEDPEEVDLGNNQNTEEFVKNAMDKAKGIWGIFNSNNVDSTTSTGQRKTRQKKDQAQAGGGFVWNLLANQAKKVMEDMEQPGAKTTKKRGTR